MNKDDAAKAKAKWLVKCLEFGWQKSDLDALSSVWDKFKDEYGNLRPSSSTTTEPTALSLCQQQMQEKDEEIERLKGLVEEAFQEHPIKRNWQQFKTDNKF